jgi:AcrR family transcriptional regulator
LTLPEWKRWANVNVQEELCVEAEALLAEAVRQVRASGADRLSLRGVAQAVGVSPSAAYNHFADKEELLGAVAAAGFEELDARIEAAAAGGGGGSGAAAAPAPTHLFSFGVPAAAAPAAS